MNVPEHSLSYLIKNIAQQLQGTLSVDCVQYAWWLLEALTHKNRSELMRNQYVALSLEQQNTLNEWIHQLVHEQKPLAYIIGSVPFCGLDLLIEPPILIPRAETEEWVHNLIQQLKKYDNGSLKILDIGTGSGCIALAMAKAFPHHHIIATDVNKKALALAQKNAHHNTITNVTFIHSDLFEQLGEYAFDIIVSNPPYIGLQEIEQVQPSVHKWEDAQALFAPGHGDAILKRIICDAPTYLTSNPMLATYQIPHLILEVGYAQAERIKQFMIAQGYDTVAITKDSCGNERVVAGSIIDEAFPTSS